MDKGRNKFTTAAILRFLIAATFVSGCSTIGTIENRSEELNVIPSNYINSSILLNILRAKEAEPINFVSLTAFTGHATATASLGLPTIIIGPGRTPAQNSILVRQQQCGSF